MELSEKSIVYFNHIVVVLIISFIIYHCCPAIPSICQYAIKLLQLELNLQIELFPIRFQLFKRHIQLQLELRSWLMNWKHSNGNTKFPGLIVTEPLIEGKFCCTEVEDYVQLKITRLHCEKSEDFGETQKLQNTESMFLHVPTNEIINPNNHVGANLHALDVIGCSADKNLHCKVEDDCTNSKIEQLQCPKLEDVSAHLTINELRFEAIKEAWDEKQKQQLIDSQIFHVELKEIINRKDDCEVDFPGLCIKESLKENDLRCKQDDDCMNIVQLQSEVTEILDQKQIQQTIEHVTPNKIISTMYCVDSDLPGLDVKEILQENDGLCCRQGNDCSQLRTEETWCEKRKELSSDNQFLKGGNKEISSPMDNVGTDFHDLDIKESLKTNYLSSKQEEFCTRLRIQQLRLKRKEALDHRRTQQFIERVRYDKIINNRDNADANFYGLNREPLKKSGLCLKAKCDYVPWSSEQLRSARKKAGDRKLIQHYIEQIICKKIINHNSNATNTAPVKDNGLCFKAKANYARSRIELQRVMFEAKQSLSEKQKQPFIDNQVLQVGPNDFINAREYMLTVKETLQENDLHTKKADDCTWLKFEQLMLKSQETRGKMQKQQFLDNHILQIGPNYINDHRDELHTNFHKLYMKQPLQENDLSCKRVDDCTHFKIEELKFEAKKGTNEKQKQQFIEQVRPSEINNLMANVNIEFHGTDVTECLNKQVLHFKLGGDYSHLSTEQLKFEAKECSDDKQKQQFIDNKVLQVGPNDFINTRDDVYTEKGTLQLNDLHTRKEDGCTWLKIEQLRLNAKETSGKMQKQQFIDNQVFQVGPKDTSDHMDDLGNNFHNIYVKQSLQENDLASKRVDDCTYFEMEKFKLEAKKATNEKQKQQFIEQVRPSEINKPVDNANIDFHGLGVKECLNEHDLHFKQGGDSSHLGTERLKFEAKECSDEKRKQQFIDRQFLQVGKNEIIIPINEVDDGFQRVHAKKRLKDIDVSFIKNGDCTYTKLKQVKTETWNEKRKQRFLGRHFLQVSINKIIISKDEADLDSNFLAFDMCRFRTDEADMDWIQLNIEELRCQAKDTWGENQKQQLFAHCGFLQVIYNSVKTRRHDVMEDFHGLFATEFKIVFPILLHGYMNLLQNEYFVIDTGKGNHSPNGKGVLKVFAAEIILEHNYCYEEIREGIYQINRMGKYKFKTKRKKKFDKRLFVNKNFIV